MEHEITLSMVLNLFRWLVLSVLIIGAVRNQFFYALLPFWKDRHGIGENLLKTDAGKLQALAPDISGLVDIVNATPASATFYVVPSFSAPGDHRRDPGLVLGVLRYMCFPRIFLSHDSGLYGARKQLYLEKFIGEARTWQELDWIRSRGIQSIILMRDNKVYFLPVTGPIGEL